MLFMWGKLAGALFALGLAGAQAGPSAGRGPIIDMHLHAVAADHNGPPPQHMCAPMERFPAWDPATDYREHFKAVTRDGIACDNPIVSAASDEALRDRTIELVEKHDIFAVLGGSPEKVAEWRDHAPGRFLPGFDLSLPREDTAEKLRALHAEGRLSVLAEVQVQYFGIGPDDERMEPIWALAEELDIPVGIHIGEGPPGTAYLGLPFKAALGDPLLLEPVLLRHPKLRVYVMHAGFPFRDRMKALMMAHPQVHADVGVLAYTRRPSQFHGFLCDLVDAGFGDRILYGTDQMVWPDTIPLAIKAIETAPCLDAQQKRDIFYNNAARFLRLDEATIARHHAIAAATP
ncbi:amidohydrolase family protein [Sphingomicrobium lutaoense]|uniref:Amidohydrolase-related domain-containing protein n=1 Tax=Sphingomicrobium lutaoense TaxID=515949 RepID=A0A839YTJ4_9SPHN|nr:amidohydrolase family protein [Sphingomicrobium lutaoense]MBB3763591.1 hypothetical protein [Sphingomicrobium lutaoense]